MLHETVRAAPSCEPCFELPPRLGVPQERRLAMLAAQARAGGATTHGFRDNAITLMVDGSGGLAPGGSAQVLALGGAVAATFGLVPGPLEGPDESLAAVLHAALDEVSGSGRVTPFEAAVATPTAACVLLRGVMLPTATGADAVLSWKEVLDADATARIRGELMREMRAPRRCAARTDAFA